MKQRGLLPHSTQSACTTRYYECLYKRVRGLFSRLRIMPECEIIRTINQSVSKKTTTLENYELETKRWHDFEKASCEASVSNCTDTG